MSKQPETTLQFYGADESAPPGTLGHALAAFDRLLAADLEYDLATDDLAVRINEQTAARASKASKCRAAAIRACKELRK